MMNLILLATCFLDGILIYLTLKSLFIGAMGDTKAFRLLKLFVAFPCGVAYTIFALNTGLLAENISFFFGCAVIFGPIAIVGIAAIIKHIHTGK